LWKTARYWILVTASAECEAGCWILDAGYWMLDAGYWMLDAGYWRMDIGCWILLSCPDIG